MVTSDTPVDITPLAAVNGQAIDTATALRYSNFYNEPFLKDAVRNELIRQYAQQTGIANTDAELQLAVDEARYGRGLESVAAVRQWMTQYGLTLLSLQHIVDLMLLRNKVRSAISNVDIQAHYAEHQLEYEEVDLYSIRVDTESKARELASQIKDEGANFHLQAMAHSTDENSRHQGGYVGRLTREAMAGSVAAAVFASHPPDPIGPIKTDHGWNLFKVTKIYRPTLAESESRIRLDLLEQLVDKLTAGAAITYPMLHGPASLTVKQNGHTIPADVVRITVDHALPPRARPLDFAEMSAVFGGCKGWMETCGSDSDCCGPKCGTGNGTRICTECKRIAVFGPKVCN